jgi:hypothetical protein
MRRDVNWRLRLRAREDHERRHLARARVRAAVRTREVARFILSTAREHGVHVVVHETRRGRWVAVWAPTALTSEHQLAYERSFKRAVTQNLGAVVLLSATPGGSA